MESICTVSLEKSVTKSTKIMFLVKMRTVMKFIATRDTQWCVGGGIVALNLTNSSQVLDPPGFFRNCHQHTPIRVDMSIS